MQWHSTQLVRLRERRGVQGKYFTVSYGGKHDRFNVDSIQFKFNAIQFIPEKSIQKYKINKKVSQAEKEKRSQGKILHNIIRWKKQQHKVQLNSNSIQKKNKLKKFIHKHKENGRFKQHKEL